MKKGLQAERTTLRLRSSQARVTSVKSVSLLNSAKDPCTSSWKSFHFRQSFSSAMVEICLRLLSKLTRLDETIINRTFAMFYNWAPTATEKGTFFCSFRSEMCFFSQQQQVPSDMLAKLITPFRPTGPRVWYGIVWWGIAYIIVRYGTDGNKTYILCPMKWYFLDTSW